MWLPLPFPLPRRTVRRRRLAGEPRSEHRRRLLKALRLGHGSAQAFQGVGHLSELLTVTLQAGAADIDPQSLMVLAGVATGAGAGQGECALTGLGLRGEAVQQRQLRRSVYRLGGMNRRPLFSSLPPKHQLEGYSRRRPAASPQSAMRNCCGWGRRVRQDLIRHDPHDRHCWASQACLCQGERGASSWQSSGWTTWA